MGVQPADGARIPGIRRWPKEYLPRIYDETRVDRIIDIDQNEAEETTIALGREEGIFAGVYSGGAIDAALKLSEDLENALIVTVICDRGDRYISTNVFKS